MSYLEDPLWQKIVAFELDSPASPLQFSQRLARENAWSLDFAQRVIQEYRRFLYLASAAGHPVTPSDEVDQAWHLHLVYTHSYWGDLCPNVLGKALHHGPTKGGASEDSKFRQWYETTLASYQRIFGSVPPSNIWPDSEMRFSSDLQWTRVNAATNWILPKTKIQKIAACLALLGVSTSLVACQGPSEAGMAIGLIVFIAIVAYLHLSRTPESRRKGDKKKSDDGCAGACNSGCSSDGDSGGCGGGGCGGGGD
ncbi:MAG: hypothetical protein NTV80_09950 [Verrucomicrobia bacterium]|nr:hypothetical protein [Verrucomicrobiota bacterium]